MNRPMLQGWEYEEMVHCCSLYTLAAAVMDGLQPGPKEGKGGKIGVYAYKRRNKKSLAASSSGYCVYTQLCTCHDEIYFGPRLCLEVQTWRSMEDGAMSMGEGQMCLQPTMFHFVGFYVHVMTRDDLDTRDLYSKVHSLRFTSGQWNSDYEVAPQSGRAKPKP